MADEKARLTDSELQRILGSLLKGAEIEIRDDTHRHAAHNEEVGHYGSHLRVRVVWDGFSGMNPVDRHRLVFEALDTPWREGKIHALSLKLLAPEEEIV